jgi:cytochrome b
MKKVLVYDWPTRLFHIVFAVLFVGSYSIAEFIDDDSKLFSYHMIMGIIMLLVVLLRVFWGLIGSRYAKFSSFELQPRKLLEYFKSMLLAKKWAAPGHNPASSWAAVLMLALAIGMGISGYLMSQDIYKETVEELHELFATAFLIVVIAHISGTILHSLRHKDMIGLSMVNGRKIGLENSQGIPSSHPWVGVLFLLVVGSFTTHVLVNYDSSNGNLDLFGATLHLGTLEGDHDDHDDHEDHDDHDD